MTKIVLIQGHPDTGKPHLGFALEEAYRAGAEAGGHELRSIRVGELDFGFLRSQDEWQNSSPNAHIKAAQESIAWAEHLVIFYPLWLGTMPAMLKAFLEQTLRPGFALDYGGSKGLPRKLLSGKSARVVITMGMPGFAYRWFYRAHSLKSLERNILKFCGIKPVAETLIGMVEAADDKQRQAWFARLRDLGRHAR